MGEVPLSSDWESTDERVVYNMLIETCDIFDSEDFSIVCNNLIQVGLNHILDRIAEFYPVSSSVNQKSSWIDKVEENSGTIQENIGSNVNQQIIKCGSSDSF